MSNSRLLQLDITTTLSYTYPEGDMEAFADIRGTACVNGERRAIQGDCPTSEEHAVPRARRACEKSLPHAHSFDHLKWRMRQRASGRTLAEILREEALPF